MSRRLPVMLEPGASDQPGRIKGNAGLKRVVLSPLAWNLSFCLWSTAGIAAAILGVPIALVAVLFTGGPALILWLGMADAIERADLQFKESSHEC